MQNVPYASAVASIMYAVRCTRPDVTFAQNITSRFQQNPSELHWTTVKNILKYLRNTKDMFLVYGGDMKQELKVSCYTDAGYLTDAGDLKSQTRYVFVLNEGVVDWKSTKQKAVWIRKFIYGLRVVPTIEEPINMYCDNIGAMEISKDHGVTKGARYFRVKVHYLRETIEMCDVRMEKVDTYDNLADPFTKALAFPKHSKLTKKIGMIPASSLMQVRVLLDVSIASIIVDCYSNSQVEVVGLSKARDLLNHFCDEWDDLGTGSYGSPIGKDSQENSDITCLLSSQFLLCQFHGQVLPPDVLNTHTAWVKASKEIAGLMLMTMDPDIQKNLEQLGAYDMLKELKTLYAQQADQELLHTMENFTRANKKKDSLMGKTVTKLHAMLTLHEQTLPPKEVAPALHVIRAGLKGSRKLKPGALSLDGFVIRFESDNSIFVSRNNLVYFNVIPRDDIYEIDLSSSNTNDSSIYVVSNKRAKLNLDSALLWHCRLKQISKKRIEKLQHDGLLDSSNIKSFEKCVSCMSRKMVRKPYTHQVERAKDLLGLIHTDVCGLFRTVSRQGASYFITFIDDFSHYGYVYLLKHKHDVFETFKVFQKEVENQLGKTIKSLRSDREGEYMSQEFLDNLKEHGIIGHRTPPYKPQHNGVSERRNRTLLDKVRSMMSQTTLPKSIRTRRPTDRLCLHVDAEEHDLGDLDIRAIRIFIAITAFYDYEIWQMDVKIAFLNGYLNEEVYVKQPEGFVNPKYPNRVCKLKHSIYGLKQASRQRNKRFDNEIKKFNQNRDEPCVYIKASGIYVTFLILYVDDILIIGNNIPMLQDVKSYLGRCFAMKDLGEAAYILGIKIYQDRSKRLIGLCQSAYIEKILKRCFIENSKRGTISMQEKLKLSKSQGTSTPAEKQCMQNIPYASAVGSIMYVVRCTRPDVAFKLKVSCYTDAGYLTDADDLKSQTGYVFILNGGVVDWKTQSKIIFATSSTDAEYIAAFDASKKVVWIQKFISRLGVVPTIEEPINMYCDNTGAIAIAKDHGVTKGARHFHAKVHYLREIIEMGDVRIVKVDTDDNLADPFRKALAFPKHSELTKKIGMISASSLM
ncbi:retrotransposon protein, putative, ty1-copia subclass [Tanacetum coccineum]